MNSRNFKYYIGICALFFIDALHVVFFDNNDRYDVYLYYEHDRYLTNILYDISNLFKFSILTYWLSRLNKTVFMPLFITSMYIWLSYFLFYNQYSSFFIIPIYLVLVVLYNRLSFKNALIKIYKTLFKNENKS